MEEIIRRYYYDPKTGFISSNALHKKLCKDGHNISLNKVRDFIKKQETAQIRDLSPVRTTVARGLNHVFQK